MDLTSRETWTLIHGLILGSLFLLAFAGGLAVWGAKIRCAGREIADLQAGH